MGCIKKLKNLILRVPVKKIFFDFLLTLSTILFLIFSLGLKIPFFLNIPSIFLPLISFGLIIFFILKLSLKYKKLSLIKKIHDAIFIFSASILILLYINRFFKVDDLTYQNLIIIFSLFLFSSGLFKIISELGDFKKTKDTVFLNSKTIFVFLILCFIGLFLLFYNLGKNNFMNDEFPTVSSAWNFSQTGNFYKWDWIHNTSSEFTSLSKQDQWADYTRAELHTTLLAKTYNLFGISEFTSRALSASFGLILFLSIFLIVKHITKNVEIAIFALLLSITSPFILEYVRYARMYALLLPINLAFVFFTFKTIEVFSEMNFQIRRLIVPFTLSFIFLILSMDLHDLSLASIPGIALFGLFYLFKHNKKLFYILTSILILFTCIFIASISLISTSNQAFTFINLLNRQYPYNYIYLTYIFNNPIGITGFFITTLWFIRELFTPKNKNYFYVYLYIIVTTCSFFLIFFIDRFAHPSYIVTFIPLYIIMLAISSYNFLMKIQNKKIIIFFYTLFIIAISVSFSEAYPRIYGDQSVYRVDYTNGYQTLIRKFNSETDSLFFQYERFYYLQNLGEDTKIYSFGNKDYSRTAENIFFQNLRMKPTSWITWESSTAGDIKTSTKAFIKTHCNDYSIANTNLYLYQCNLSTISSHIPNEQ